MPGEHLPIHQWSHLHSRRECDHKRTGPWSVPAENLGEWKELEIQPHHFAGILAAVRSGDLAWSGNSGKECSLDDFGKIGQHEHRAFGVHYVRRKLELLCWTEGFVAFQDRLRLGCWDSTRIGEGALLIWRLRQVSVSVFGLFVGSVGVTEQVTRKVERFP